MLPSPWRAQIRIGLGGVAMFAAVAFAVSGFWTEAILALITCAAGLALLDWTATRGAFSTSKPRQLANVVASDPVASLMQRLPNDYYVISALKTGSGKLDHLVLRDDGALFAIKVHPGEGEVSEHEGVLLISGHPLEEDVLTTMLANGSWLMERLTSMLQTIPLVHLALYFPHATTHLHRPVCGVHVLEADAVGRWLGRPGGDPNVARRLWPLRARLKAYLAATNGSLSPET